MVMSIRLRTTVLCIVVHLICALASTTSAQSRLPTEPANASARQTQAWAAWRATQNHDTTAIPALVQVVESILPSLKNQEDHQVLDAALDALIQLEAVVPVGLVEKVYAHRPAASLILLARTDRSSDGYLINLLTKQRGYAWFVAANLVIQRRVPGTTAALLRGVEVAAHIFVSNRTQWSSAEGVAGAIVGDGGGGQAAGFPPLATYHLGLDPTIGAVVVAGGPTSVFYHRAVSTAAQGPTATTHDTLGPLTGDRLKYVGAASGLTGQLPLSAIETLTVRDRGAQQLAHDIATFQAAIQRRFAQMLRMLVATHNLTDGEAASLTPLKITVTVHKQ